MHGHPGVQEACVSGVTDPNRGETAKACVVRRSEHAETTADSLGTGCREHVAIYKMPSLIEFIGSRRKSGARWVM